MEETRVSTLVAPPRRWLRPLGYDERLWFAVAFIWALAMFVMMFFVWPAVGDQNVNIESWRVTQAEWATRTQAFIDEYGTGEQIGGVPVVAPPPGDVYIMATRFQFRPVLRLQKDQKYRFLISSNDVQHGFSLQPDNVNFQILPGYVSAIDMTPTKAGEYQLVCNEFCGLGHQFMLGKIIVVE